MCEGVDGFAPAFLDKLPRPVTFGLYGMLAGLLAALTAGELVWHLLRPPLDVTGEAEKVAPRSPSSPKIAFAVSPKLQIYPGGTNFVAVRIARSSSDDSVTVRFSPTAGLIGSEFTIPAGESSAQHEDHRCGNAETGSLRSSRATRLLPDGSMSQIATVEVSVLPLPPPPPRLAVSVSPKVQAYQRGKNTFAVRTVRGDFDGEVTVSFSSLPTGVTIPDVTIPAGQSEATAELTAEGSTKTGPHKLIATARTAFPGVAPANTETQLEVLGSPKLPVDVVFVLDCTGSMKKTVAGIEASLPKFASELTKAQLEARFVLVGFQDRTLGQMLQVPQFGWRTDDDGHRQTAHRDQRTEARWWRWRR